MNERDESIRIKRQFWRRIVKASVAGVIVPPLLGLVGTVVGMVGAFGELSKNSEGDPRKLAKNISVAMVTTMWGLAISLLSIMVFIGSAIKLGRHTFASA